MRVDKAWDDDFAFCVYPFVASSVLPFQFGGFSDICYLVVFDGYRAVLDFALFAYRDYCSVVDEYVHLVSLRCFA